MRVTLNVGTETVLDEKIEDDRGPANTDVALAVVTTEGHEIELTYDETDRTISFRIQADGGESKRTYRLRHGEWAVIA